MKHCISCLIYYVNWNFSERCGIVIFYSIYSDWDIERTRKSEVEIGLNCTVFCSPANVSKFLQTIFYYTKISSFEGIIKGFLVKEVALEGTQRNLSRHRMLLSYNFMSSLFLRTFPEKVRDPSSVYNRQSICLQLTEHCAQPTEYMFATDRSVMHCAQPTE